jgi:hypothetical protein
MTHLPLNDDLSWNRQANDYSSSKQKWRQKFVVFEKRQRKRKDAIVPVRRNKRLLPPRKHNAFEKSKKSNIVKKRQQQPNEPVVLHKKPLLQVPASVSAKLVLWRILKNRHVTTPTMSPVTKKRPTQTIALKESSLGNTAAVDLMPIKMTTAVQRFLFQGRPWQDSSLRPTSRSITVCMSSVEGRACMQSATSVTSRV